MKRPPPRCLLRLLALAMTLGAAAAPPGEALPLGEGLRLGGLFYADYYGLIDPSVGYENGRLRITAAPELSGGVESGWLDYRLSAVLFVDFFREPRFVEPARMLREAVLGLHFGKFDISLGQTFVNWGKVDVLSPLNVINHSDTTVLSLDNVFESVLPDILARVQYFPTDFLNFEVVYVPFLQPNLYDFQEIRIDERITVPALVTGTEMLFDVKAAFLNRTVPLFSEWANSVYTAVRYTSFLFDLVASYANYVDHDPDFDVSGISETVDSSGTPEEHVITGTAYATYNRVQNIGLGITFYLGDLLVSLDSALKLTANAAGTRLGVKKSEVFTVLQLEQIFFGNWRAQANVFYRQIINADAPVESAFTPLFEAYFNGQIEEYLLQSPASQLYFLLHVDTSFLHEKLLLGATFLYQQAGSEAAYLVPRLAYKLSDYLTVATGADIWWARESVGLLGINEDRDNFFVRLELRL
jgi:hypothetical protein